MATRRHCVYLLGQRCVYCQQSFKVGERSLTGTSRYLGYTDAFDIPNDYLIEQSFTVAHVGGQDEVQPYFVPLGLYLNFSYCESSHHVYLVHQECLDIRANLLPERATYKEIFDIGRVTRPWFISPTRKTLFKPSRGALRTCLHTLENSPLKNLVQKLVDLPEELFRMIMDKADNSTLARITLVLQFNNNLVRRLKFKLPLAELDFTSTHLRTFDFTFLGIHYDLVIKNETPATDTAVLRLGADHIGIRTVEILKEHPTTARQNLPNCLWYIVERLERARALFKLIQSGPFLSVASRSSEPRIPIQMWNVMNPPEYGSYHSISDISLTHPRRTRCIDLSGMTGLTVFCTLRATFGIHVHFGDETATSTYQDLYSTDKHGAMWIYFPLGPQEVISKAWVHRGRDYVDILVVHTSRDRRCFFGGYLEVERGSYEVLCDVPMRHLLYDEVDLGSISWFGATPMPSILSNIDLKDDRRVPGFVHTRASLLHADQAEVYSDNNGASTGILFRYLDGSSECIGQRRVGLGSTKITRFHRPHHIHFKAFEIKPQEHLMLPYTRDCVEAQFSSGNSEPLFEEWDSQDMIGTVTWLLDEHCDFVELSGQP